MARRRQYKRTKRECNQNNDIISDLADYVLIHILSFLKTKQAVQTCILSKRWINLWKNLPSLTLSHFDLRYINLFQKPLKDAASHNVKHLKLILDVPTIEYFSSCCFSCLTLTSLNLEASYFKLLHAVAQPQIFPNSLNLPALTTLSLKYFAFRRSDDGYVEPFSAFNMLNTLIVHSCVVLDGQKYLRISSTKLANLTIHLYRYRNFPGSTFGIELYNAPSLHTYAFTSEEYFHKLYGS
jgi:hypothetical protein